MADANVACRQAGFGSGKFMALKLYDGPLYLTCTILAASAFLANAAFGEGIGPIWMSDLTCGTTELSLFDCSSSTPLGSVENTTMCRHANDVAVRCQGTVTGDSSAAYHLLI